jgi:peptidoglycan/xylan/chitin deacetylase (PgdA/CDA1 family)
MRRLLLGVLAALVAGGGAVLTARDLRAAAAFDPLRAVATPRAELALTFEVTGGDVAVPAVLAALGDARATFFLTGSWASGHAAAVRQILAAGDEVESLGNQAVALTRYPEAAVRGQLAQAVAALRRLGVQPRFLRPPGGLWGPALLRLAEAADLRLALWDVDSGDWARPGPDAIVARVLAAAHPGAVVRLQADDGLPATVAALRPLLRGLAAKGLRPVTLAELTR